MNCIIIDDEPLAREAIQLLIDKNEELKLRGAFNSNIRIYNFYTGEAVTQ
jgi:two-component system, LytTR family, response regulator